MLTPKTGDSSMAIGNGSHALALIGTQTRTKRGQRNADKTRTPLPHGYRIREMKDGRKKPFLLIVRQRVNEAFETEKQAASAAKELLDKEAEFGREVRAFDVREWRRYLDAKRKHFGNREPDWDELARRLGAAASTKTVKEAIAAYIKIREADGLSPDTMRQARKKLARLQESFGARMLHDVTTEDLRAWAFPSAKGAPLFGFAPWTIRDHIKVCLTFWHAARAEKWTDSNPMENVKAPRVTPETVTLLSVDDAKKLFDANRGQKVIGKLALEAFCGLRFSSAARLCSGDIKMADLGIELPGKKHKSGRRHYIDGLPDNLWLWIKSAPAGAWDLTERQYLDEKANAFIRAGVMPLHNCLRHSFCSYHIAKHKSADATAIILQHTSARTLFRFYKGRATAADGQAYFDIKP